MTVDEAIKHAENVAEEKEAQAWEAQLQEEYKKIKSCEKCAEEHRQLAEWLKELKQLKEQTGWIPVSEKLPKVDEEVFISFGHGSPLEIGKYNGKQWEYLYESGADYWTEPLFEVKAWMPLPDRYKE